MTYLKARDGCSRVYRTQILLKYMKQMQYQVTIREIPQDAPIGKIKNARTDAEEMFAVKFA